MRGSRHISRLLAAAVSSAIALLLTTAPLSASGDEGWRSHVSTVLQSIYDANAASATSGSVAGAGSITATDGAHLDAQGRIEADVHHDCSSAAPLAALIAAGFSVESRAELPPLCVVEGWVPLTALPAVASVEGVTGISLPTYVVHRPRPAAQPAAAAPAATTIDGNAVSIMHADQFVSQAGGGGAGVLVGVQSQGVASLSAIQDRGELPSVNVLTSAAGGSPSAADEGTMLLEEVHAVAPTAGLAFCEPQTFVQYTSCLEQLVGAGSTIMVDDLLFLDQDPMSSGSTDVTALEQFLAQNPTVLLFTAAGNYTGSYWEGDYTPVSVSSQGISPLTCQGQTDSFVNELEGGATEILTITTADPISVPVIFAWADPPGENSSKFDVYWQNPDSAYSGCLSTASATDPVVTQTIELYPGSNVVYVATPDDSEAGKFLKLWVGGDGLTALSVSTAGAYVTPQSFATGVSNIGAVNGSDGVGNSIEPFSSMGPITVVYPSPATIQAPTLVAPDGIYVDASGTYFEDSLFPDGNFYGTSAAAPNAAAVAALIRGAFPELTVDQVLTALENGAAQLGASAPDDTFGYGRVDAMGALATLPAPTISSLADVSIDASSSSTSAAVSFDVTGTGSLHFVAASTNTTLVPALVVAAGQPGVTVSPTTCGRTTLACSLTVTAAPYQGGSATVTVSAVDGAGRSAPATMHVTVSNPQMPPAPVKGGGGSLRLWDLLAIGILVVRRAAARRSPGELRRP